MVADCRWPCPGSAGAHKFEFGECTGPFPVLVEETLESKVKPA